MLGLGTRDDWFTLKGWEVPAHQSSFSPTGDNRWSNKDMDPVPIEEQVWTTWAFVTYWLCDSFGVGTLSLAASMIASGMSWQMSIGAIAAGNIFISWIMVANGTVGASLHTSFAVTARGSFGFWLSYFCVVSRLVLATVWFGVNSYSGALGLYQCFRAMWPSIATMPNHIPESQGITSNVMVAYFCYFVFQTLMAMVSPNRLRYAFLIKTIIGPATGFAMMGYYIHKSGFALYGGASTITGSTLAYLWLSSMNSSAGSYSTLSVNIADFTRYAQKPSQQYIQVLVIPISFIFFAWMGIAIASGAQAVNGGDIEFNVVNIIGTWDNRATTFFAGFAFFYSMLCQNISANSLSAANDWCCLFPKYLNIKRGAFLTSLLGCWAMAPWKVLASADSFLSFMGGYVIFMAPIAGIMMADYYFIKGRKVDIPALYDPRARYRYNKYGINWRALVTLLIAVGPCMPGFCNSINPSIPLIKGMQHFYTVAWVYGTVSSITIYTALSKIWSPKETIVSHMIRDYDDAAYRGTSTQTPSLEDEEKKLEAETGVVMV